MAYKLDPSKAEVRYLSNDAFFWLKDEEDPIDEGNLEEAQEILAMFPNGFVIKDDWKYDDDDTVEATFIPYVDDIDIKWDGEHRITLNNGKVDTCAFYFKIISHDKCYVRWCDDATGKCIYEGECEVKYFYKNPWAITPKGSQIPLWGKNAKYFTSNRF